MLAEDGWIGGDSPLGPGGGWINDGDIAKCIAIMTVLLVFTCWDRLTREDSWPEGKWAPYQVQLDQGSLIYAPIDDDKAVRDIKDAPEGVDDAGGRPEPPPPTKSPMTWEEIKAWDT